MARNLLAARVLGRGALMNVSIVHLHQCSPMSGSKLKQPGVPVNGPR